METKRLILRPFTEEDNPAVFAIFSDPEVNRFLPWFPLRSIQEASDFRKTRLSGAFAVALKKDNIPIGYVTCSDDEVHDFGYGLRKEYWHQGIVSEAAAACIAYYRDQGIPFLTATHDIRNPRSGEVMKRLGMVYQYTYEEQWQPKDIPVTFRLYLLSLDGREHHCDIYWQKSQVHCVEQI